MIQIPTKKKKRPATKMMKNVRSHSVSSEEGPSSPSSTLYASPQPSPSSSEADDNIFGEEEEVRSILGEDPHQTPQYSPAYRPDDKENNYPSYYFNSNSPSPPPTHPHHHPQPSSPSPGPPHEATFGCQEDFVKAVRSGDARTLKRVLSRYSPLIEINRSICDGQTALTQSCLDGNAESIKILLSYGANPQLANRDGFLPLHVACYRGRLDLLKFFIR